MIETNKCTTVNIQKEHRIIASSIKKQKNLETFEILEQRSGRQNACTHEGSHLCLKINTVKTATDPLRGGKESGQLCRITLEDKLWYL